ncbi:MAG: uroporphyrinogen-III synthase, partial [Parasporobacterium sp.]|nr:uroporphyrinogen-III synthase [Parasporobacterium sp.]
PLDAAQKNLASYDWVIFTSTNGVDLFFDRLLQNGKDARAFANNKIAAIGTATADMLTAYGLTADLIPASYKAEDLVDTLLPQLHKGSKVLLARAKEARNVLPDSLQAAGADVDVVAVYQTVSDCENKEDIFKNTFLFFQVGLLLKPEVQERVISSIYKICDRGKEYSRIAYRCNNLKAGALSGSDQGKQLHDQRS